MDLLRFTTTGSVDDGKSTLIGRLLYDSKSIFEDQLEAIERSSLLRGEEGINLALLTDGLRAEREQGITIDVAYRYFATPRRKFIIADTPGHIQYTRNMVTGASTADLSILLIDARLGVGEQTRRHAFIANLLGIKHLVICINKMDLIDFSETRYEAIKEDFEGFASKLQIPNIIFIPISALKGDNVVDESENMPWYKGATLLYNLENVNAFASHNHVHARFPVQYVIRPQTDEFHDYRGYAGTVAGGVFKPQDEVTLLPSGFSSKIKSIDTMDGPLDEAFAPMSVTLTLEDNYDLSRGDMIVKKENQPQTGQDLDIMVCWLSDEPMVPRGKYVLRHTTQEARCMIKEVRYKVDINTLHRVEQDLSLGMNDIGRIQLRVTKPLFYDSYLKNRITGSLILVDEFTNNTVAAGIIL